MSPLAPRYSREAEKGRIPNAVRSISIILALGGRGRGIRNLGSVLAVYQIQGQARIRETLPSKQQTKIKARKIKINKQTKPCGAGKWLSG